MNTVECREVIVSTIASRGKGTTYSPIRAITQVFEKDGTLIAEHDPTPETFVEFDLVRFCKWAYTTGINFDNLSSHTVHQWLDSFTNKNNHHE